MDVFTLSAKLTLDKAEFDSGITEAENKMQSWGVTVGNLAAAGIKKGVQAVTEFGKSVVETGADFEAAMDEVRALRTDATEEQMDQLSKKAQELGASTKFTATEVANAFKYMALAGWDTQEMLDGIEGVLSLSAASGESLAQTSDIVTDALTAMGYTAADTQEFVDVLAAASANSNTTVGMMGQAFKYLATVGGTLGYTIEDVAIALGLLANNGIKSSQAGTSMRQILNTLIAPTDKAADAMAKLGIYLFEEGTDKRIPLLDVMKNLREVFKNSDFDLEGQTMEEAIAKVQEVEDKYAEAFAFFQNGGKGKFNGKIGDEKVINMTEKDVMEEYTEDLKKATQFNEEFLKSLSDIGGLRGISSLLALMKSTDEDFDQLVGAVTNSEGAANTMAETMIDNLQGDITILNSAMDGLKILISEDFNESFRSFVQNVTEGVGEIRKGFEEGGLLGMFTNLASWVINGITDALKNVNTEDASKFGKAIGDFVGSTISMLITSAPELLSGLFEAGVSIADGLIQGLFAGLFGTGADSVPGMILSAEEKAQDTIDEANESATRAKGILGYMDSLKEKYGDAAESTDEWASALEKLKQVYPEINDYIAQENGQLSLTNQSLLEYIENTKQRIATEARQKALQSYIQEYQEALQQQTEEEIKREMATSQMSEARKELIAYIQSHAGQEGFTGNGMSMDQIAFAARQLANEFGESQSEIDSLVKIYNENAKAAQDSETKIKQLSESTVLLKTAMDNAERALLRLEERANSKLGWTTYGQWANEYYGKPHAIGSNYIPYDNYPALLHRGEQVLTATQARQRREGTENGGNAVDYNRLSAAVVTAIREGMNGATVNSYLSGRRVTDNVNRSTASQVKAERFRP